MSDHSALPFSPREERGRHLDTQTRTLFERFLLAVASGHGARLERLLDRLDRRKKSVAGRIG